MLPSQMTTTSSTVSASSPIRWEESSTVRPASACSRRKRRIQRMPSGSRPLTGSSRSPGCGNLSDRVHSRYELRLSDTAISDREVLIRLRVRRLFCAGSPSQINVTGCPPRCSRRSVRNSISEAVL
ncbi:transposase family protein [Saccharopolyspora sp. NPDC000995]